MAIRVQFARCRDCRQQKPQGLVCLGGFRNIRGDYDYEGLKLELDETIYEWGTCFEIEVETVRVFLCCFSGASVMLLLQHICGSQHCHADRCLYKSEHQHLQRHQQLQSALSLLRSHVLNKVSAFGGLVHNAGLPVAELCSYSPTQSQPRPSWRPCSKPTMSPTSTTRPPSLPIFVSALSTDGLWTQACEPVFCVCF